MKKYYAALSDIVEFKRTKPSVQYRYFFAPSKPLTSGLEVMSFDPDVTGPMVKIGQDDAERVIKAGKGALFEKLEEWHTQKLLNKNFKHYHEYISSTMDSE